MFASSLNVQGLCTPYIPPSSSGTLPLQPFCDIIYYEVPQTGTARLILTKDRGEAVKAALTASVSPTATCSENRTFTGWDLSWAFFAALMKADLGD